MALLQLAGGGGRRAADPLVEGKHSEIVRNLGGRRTRYLSIDRVLAGEVIRCLAVNLKRFFKLEPLGMAVAAV